MKPSIGSALLLVSVPLTEPTAYAGVTPTRAAAEVRRAAASTRTGRRRFTLASMLAVRWPVHPQGWWSSPDVQSSWRYGGSAPGRDTVTAATRAAHDSTAPQVSAP